MATADGVYKKGSLAALRAERATKKQQTDNKNNILMPEKLIINPDPPPTHHNNKHTTNTQNNTQNNLNPNNDDSLSAPTSTDPTHIPSHSGYIDEYGFVVSDEEKKAKLAEIGSDTHKHYIRKQNERIYKWLHMLDHWDVYNTTKKAKLKSRIRKGIPAPLRAKVWKKILGTSNLTKQQRLYYSKLRYESPSNKFKTAIDNDLDRTFPRHVLFSKIDSENNENNNGKLSPSGRGKDSLRNVLYAYANHDLDVGYTQGMGFIAALLLMLMTEDDAFWCLCKLLDQNGEFAMRGLYLDGLPLLHMRYYQFNALLNKFMPKLYAHIASFDISPALYASKWFITIFCYEFPFEFVYRIWDIYLHEGAKFMFRVALALMKLNEHILLKIKAFDVMMKYLQSLHLQNDLQVNQLLHKAFDLALKHQHLQEIEQEYNIKKLRDQRRPTGGGVRRRDVSEMEQPSFLKNLSQENTGTTPYTPSGDGVSTPGDYKVGTVAITPAPDEENFNEEKKLQVEDVHGHEGSHSESSYVEEEPSSVLPNSKEHDIIIPDKGDDVHGSDKHVQKEMNGVVE